MLEQTRARLAFAALLVTATVLCAALGGCNPLTQTQKDSILKLQEHGAKINFRGSGYEVLLTNCPEGTDDDMKHVAALGNVTVVDIRGTSLTDAGLKHLEAVEPLQTVRLTHTMITRDGIARFQKARPKAVIAER